MKVSIGIIALNEENCLPDILADIKQQTYPHEKIELLLVDSGSLDDTKNIMLSFAEKNRAEFLGIKVLNNPGKKQANGWNVVLRNYQGDAIIRIDAHAHIPIDFISKRVGGLLNGEYICGGRCPAMCKDNKLSTRILLAAENAMFGSSISKFRNSNVTCYVDSISHGAYCREVFDKVGFFDERLGRTEDNDIHQRIRAAGYRILFDKNMISYRYVRPTLKKILRQKFLNGYWIGKTVYINPRCLSAYYFVPLVFVLTLFISLCLFLNGYAWPFLILMFAYGSVIIISTICSMWEKKDIRFISVGLICFMMHVSYGLGTVRGLLKI